MNHTNTCHVNPKIIEQPAFHVVNNVVFEFPENIMLYLQPDEHLISNLSSGACSKFKKTHYMTTLEIVQASFGQNRRLHLNDNDSSFRTGGFRQTCDVFIA